jgi:hypothetical protein
MTSSFSNDALPLRRSRCQPSDKAGTNPKRSTPRTTFRLQLGSSRLGNTIAATCRITQALTIYVGPGYAVNPLGLEFLEKPFHTLLVALVLPLYADVRRKLGEAEFDSEGMHIPVLSLGDN